MVEFRDPDLSRDPGRLDTIYSGTVAAAIEGAFFRKTSIAISLEYTKPISRLTAHLAGYDPVTCPEFTWPERLNKARDEIRKKAQARSDAAGQPK